MKTSLAPTARPSVGVLAMSALACLVAAGCNVIPPPQTDSTKTYVLTGPVLSDVPSNPAAGALRLGLREVGLVGYLNSRDMVVRSGSNEIELQDYARWAEPLTEGVSRILRSQLTAAPTVGRVYSQPVPFDAARDYDVTITILRCEGSIGESRPSAHFAASIEIETPGPDSKVVARKMYVAPDAPWDGKSYGELASLLSDDVGGLGKAVIAALPASP